MTRAYTSVLLLSAALAGAAAADNTTLDTQRVLGTPCTNHWDCNVLIQYSQCLNGICRCLDEYITQENRCMIRTNQECPATVIPSPLCADPHASCVSEPFQYPSGWWGSVHYCRCDDGYLHDAQHDQCRTALDYPCNAEVPCIAGECNAVTDRCVCPGFFVPSSDGLSCLAGLGALCATTACADVNSECVTSICVCAADFQSSSKTGDVRPVCRKRLGAWCAEDEECAAELAGCEERTLRAPDRAHACVCTDGHVPSDSYDSCLPVQGVYGGGCSSSAQCAATWGRRAGCAGGTCACAAGYQHEWQTSSCVRQ